MRSVDFKKYKQVQIDEIQRLKQICFPKQLTENDKAAEKVQKHQNSSQKDTQALAFSNIVEENYQNFASIIDSSQVQLRQTFNPASSQ